MKINTTNKHKNSTNNQVISIVLKIFECHNLKYKKHLTNNTES